MNDKPFIHVFSMADEYFFYDVNKNNILQIDSDIYDFLIKEKSICNDEKITNSINNLKARGYLSNKRISKIEHPMSKLVGSYLTSKLQSICLQITQDCNLRCNYCVYSGGYQNRGHSKKVMSTETAKKAVDFLINNSSESDFVNIGFYGGEPLLNFELIQEIVFYIMENYHGKEYYFSVTTNGTIFNKTIFDFLERYRFAVTISIDGNKEIHNASRIFAGSQTGSFDVIMKNIEKIKKEYRVLSERLRFSVVLSVASDFVGCNEFFSNTDILKDTSLMVANVSNRYKEGEYNKQKISNVIAQRYELFKCILVLIGKLDEKCCSKMIENYYHQVRERYRQFYITENGVDEVTHPAGPCIPGALRLFVNADGDFYPCEKVSEDSQVATIGNLDKGFNLKNINRILNVGKLGKDMCRNCWAYRYCKLCISSVDDLDKISLEKKKECCKQIKDEVEVMMKEYCFVSKYGKLEED